MEQRLKLQVEEQVTKHVPSAPPPRATPLDRRLIEVLECVEPGQPVPSTAFTPFHIKHDDAALDRMTGMRAVHDLVTSPELLNAMSAILGPAITYSYAGICRTRLPDETVPPSRASLPFPLHQDSQYYDTAHFSGSEAGMVRPGLENSTEHIRIVTVWMPLVDTDEQNGCLRYYTDHMMSCESEFALTELPQAPTPIPTLTCTLPYAPDATNHEVSVTLPLPHVLLMQAYSRIPPLGYACRRARFRRQHACLCRR